ARGQPEGQGGNGDRQPDAQTESLPGRPAHVRVTVRASQVTTRRSINVTRPKRMIAIAPSSVMAANILAVSSWLEEISTSCPSPESAPAHSANSAPITATAITILVPLKKKGRADGSSTLPRI